MKFVSKDLKVENGIVQLVLTISLCGHVLSFPILSFLCHHCHCLKNLLENNVTCANLDHMAFNGKLPYSSLRGMLSLPWNHRPVMRVVLFLLPQNFVFPCARLNRTFCSARTDDRTNKRTLNY